VLVVEKDGLASTLTSTRWSTCVSAIRDSSSHSPGPPTRHIFGDTPTNLPLW